MVVLLTSIVVVLRMVVKDLCKLARCYKTLVHPFF